MGYLIIKRRFILSNWNNRFIDMARLVATWSKDPSSKVGAVIVDDKKRIVSVGFNGYPKGIPDEYNGDREDKLRKSIHAEENAILFAKCDLSDLIIYVTHPPCSKCGTIIIQSGIKKVICLKPSDDFLERWKVDIDTSKEMFNHAGVELIYID